MKLDLTKPGNPKTTFLKDATRAVIVINLLLALVAMLKDVLLASYLGTRVQADAFWLAFFIPDMVANLLGGSLGIACIPVFARLQAAGEEDRLKNTVTSLVLSFGLASLCLYLALFFTRNAVIHSLGPSLSRDTLALCIDLFEIMLPLVLVLPFIYIGTAVLQVHHRFNLPALAPVLFNLIFLGGVLSNCLLSVPVHQGVYLLAAAVLTGIGAMMVLIWIGICRYRLRALAWHYSRGFRKSAGEIKEVGKIFFPYLLILLSAQAVYSVERYLASGLEAGSIAGLNYAFRIAQFPLWVFVAAVSTVAFPAMSRAVGLGQAGEIKDTLARSLRQVLLIILPLTTCLFILRVPVISILFERGSFNAGSVRITAGILAGYALGIIWQGITVICLRAFLAVGRAFMVLLSFAVTAGLNIFLDFFLVKTMGLAGLGYGAAVSALVNAVILLILLARVLKLEIKKQLGGFLRILLANLFLLPVAVFLAKGWELFGAGSGWGFKVGYALLVVAVGLPVYRWSLCLFKARTGLRNGV